MFAYVGTEQGLADWISKFLADNHGLDPHTAGAQAVSWFWGLLTAGCVLSMLLLRLFDSRRVLVGSALAAMAVLTAALLGPAAVAIWAFPAVGFCISSMWPIIMSLGLNSVEQHQGAVAGILCTAMCGGAVVPLVIGQAADLIGLRTAMFALYATLAWILSIGFWANPVIGNKTRTSERRVPSLKSCS
jgi:fucose permease